MRLARTDFPRAGNPGSVGLGLSPFHAISALAFWTSERMNQAWGSYPCRVTSTMDFSCSTAPPHCVQPLSSQRKAMFLIMPVARMPGQLRCDHRRGRTGRSRRWQPALGEAGMGTCRPLDRATSLGRNLAQHGLHPHKRPWWPAANRLRCRASGGGLRRHDRRRCAGGPGAVAGPTAGGFHFLPQGS